MQRSAGATTGLRYRPGLAWLAAAAAGWVFVLVLLGAFTTSIGAGMVFQDWPLSNGSLNPPGWLQNLAMFAEHAHRLSVGIMSVISLWLAAVLWRFEERRWLRRLAWFAVGLLVIQAIAGGLRVLLDSIEVKSVDTSLGQLIAMLHACLAQMFVCVVLAIAAALSRPWMEGARKAPAEVGLKVRILGAVCCALLLIQLAIAAVMRHSFSGLAIPTFPLMPDGGLLPAHWNFGVSINFAHRAMAIALTVVMLGFVAAVWRDQAAGPSLKNLGVGIVLLLCIQILLGAEVIWSARNPYVMTGHVVVGAFLSATTFLLTWIIHRQRIENTGSQIVPEPLAEAAPILATARSSR